MLDPCHAALGLLLSSSLREQSHPRSETGRGEEGRGMVCGGIVHRRLDSLSAEPPLARVVWRAGLKLDGASLLHQTTRSCLDRATSV